MSVIPWEARMEAGNTEQWCGITFQNKRHTWNRKEVTCLIYLAHAFQTHLFTPFLPATPEFCCFSNIWWDVPFLLILWFCDFLSWTFSYLLHLGEKSASPCSDTKNILFSCRQNDASLFSALVFVGLTFWLAAWSAGRDAPRVCCITSYDPLKGFLRRPSTNLGLSLSLSLFFFLLSWCTSWDWELITWDVGESRGVRGMRGEKWCRWDLEKNLSKEKKYLTGV